MPKSIRASGPPPKPLKSEMLRQALRERQSQGASSAAEVQQGQGQQPQDVDAAPLRLQSNRTQDYFQPAAQSEVARLRSLFESPSQSSPNPVPEHRPAHSELRQVNVAERRAQILDASQQAAQGQRSMAPQLPQVSVAERRAQIDGSAAREWTPENIDSYSLGGRSRNATRSVVKPVFEQHLGGAEKIAEIGSGMGDLHAMVPNDYRSKITETDPSESVVQKRQKYKVRQATAQTLSEVVGNDNDAVVGLSTFDVIPSREQAAAAQGIYQALKPGGKFVHFMDVNPEPSNLIADIQGRNKIPVPVGRGFAEVDRSDLEDGMDGWAVDHQNRVNAYMDEPLKYLTDRTTLKDVFDAAVEGQGLPEDRDLYHDIYKDAIDRADQNFRAAGFEIVENKIHEASAGDQRSIHVLVAQRPDDDVGEGEAPRITPPAAGPSADAGKAPAADAGKAAEHPRNRPGTRNRS